MNQLENKKAMRIVFGILLVLLCAVHPPFISAETVDEWLERETGSNDSGEGSRPVSTAGREGESPDQEQERAIENAENDDVYSRQPSTDSELENWSSGQGLNIITTVLKLVFYLVLILGLIYGLAKFIQMRQRNIHPHRLLHVMGGVSFGPNRSVQLIRVGGKYYLIGVGDSVQLIREIDDDAHVQRIEKELEEQESVVSKSFQDIFSNILTRNSGRSDANAMQDKLTDSMARQRQKRQQMEQSLNANQDKEGRTS